MNVCAGPTAGGAGSMSSGSMPTYLMNRAVHRLAMVVVVLGIFSIVGALLNAVGPGLFGWTETCAFAGATIYGGLVVLSAGFVWLLRAGRLRPPTALTLGLLYEVVFAFAISYSEMARPHEPGHLLPGISFVVVLIILFPLFVPSRLSHSLLAALAAATTGPMAAVLYVKSAGTPIPPFGDFLWAYLFNYVTVFIAMVPAGAIRRMGREVASARKLGSYQIKEKLGEGGMGEVWEGVHHRLGRAAAVKLIRPEYLASGSDDGSTAIRRFEREARATANLQSFHTVQVYDYGTTEDGTFFYVMEMLRGFPVDDLVKKFGPMPEERVIHFLKQACDSLWDAHESGLIHRDIKPANLFVCLYGRKPDVVKVLDFGLVKSTGDLMGGETQLTQAGSTTGTPAYMAPELVLGEKNVDGRADLYALGCVAYWLLTGEKVFDEENAMKMALAHVRDEPEPPSARTELPISKPFEDLIMSCLAKDPNERPQTAAQLMARLETLAPETAWTEERAQRWWSAHQPTVVTRKTSPLPPMRLVGQAAGA